MTTNEIVMLILALRADQRTAFESDDADIACGIGWAINLLSQAMDADTRAACVVAIKRSGERRVRA